MKTKLPSLVTISILTVITVAFWIALDVYRALTTKPAPAVSEEVLSPLDPTLDQEELDKLRNRLYFDNVDAITIPLQSLDNEPIVEPTSQPTSEPTPVATSEAELSQP